MMLAISATLLALAQAPSQAATPVSYVAYVGESRGRCTYATGDVIFDAAQFEEDLRRRFDRANGLLIYHDRSISHFCLASALRIGRRVGFVVVRDEIAPPDLDMGPPRSQP